MRIKNVSETDRVIAASGQKVDVGESVDVGDELGRSLCEQVDVWQQAAPELFDDDDPVEGDA